MIRNNLTLLQIFCILMLGVSLFLFFLAWMFHREASLDGAVPGSVVLGRETMMFRNIYLSLGLVVIIPSFGLLARQKWAITVFMVIFWLIGIIWTVFFLYLLGNRIVVNEWQAIFVLVALTILIYSALIAGVLYIDNAYVLVPLGNKDAPEELLDDVLDQ